jgi:hypothetical protein
MRSIKKNALRIAAATVASGLLTAGAATLAGTASAATTYAHAGTRYSFTTLDNQRDPAFNQLLGINDEGVISGYFGSGAAGQPNKGYLLLPPYRQYSYLNENFPGSAQTQVTGLNNQGVTVGFWSNTNMGVGMDANFGWVNVDGHFRTTDFPTSDPATPAVDQNLGVNDNDIAVGFYTDGQNVNHGYEYDIRTGTYTTVTDPGDPATSLTAAAINDRDDVAGVYTNPANGNTDGFLLTRGGQFIDLAAPGASSTMALGVNNFDEVVGVFVPSSDANALEGFTWTPQHGFSVVNDPKGVNDGNLTTTINGVNDFGQLVGFYVDANGNTDGFLATPRGH